MKSRVVIVPLSLCAIATFAFASPAVAEQPEEATAPPKKVCHLLTDPEGDGRSGVVPLLASPALDILSGDVASGDTTVVGVLRLKTTDLTNDPAALLGMRWVFGFTIDRADYLFSTTYSPNGGHRQDFTGGDGTGLSATVGPNSITWTLPRSAFPNLTTGSVFTQLRAVTSVFGGSADVALSSRTYTDQTPSCVPAA